MREPVTIVLYQSVDNGKQSWAMYFGGHAEADKERDLLRRDGDSEMLRIDAMVEERSRYLITEVKGP